MRALRNNPWISTVFLAIWLAICLAQAGAAAAATAPGPGGQPAITPQPRTSVTTANGGTAVNNQPAANSEAASWADASPAAPADALNDPVFWAVLGLVVLGHFVLAADFQQGG